MIEVLSTQKLEWMLNNILSSAEWMRSETRHGFPDLFAMADKLKEVCFRGSESDEWYFYQQARYHTNKAVRHMALFCHAACRHHDYPGAAHSSNADNIRFLHDQAVHYCDNTVIRG